MIDQVVKLADFGFGRTLASRIINIGRASSLNGAGKKPIPAAIVSVIMKAIGLPSSRVKIAMVL